MHNLIDNFTKGILMTLPSLYNAVWVLMFQVLINKRSTVFNKEKSVDKLLVNFGFVCVWVGLLAWTFTEYSVVTWDIYLVRYGMAILFTWAYFYHVKKFNHD